MATTGAKKKTTTPAARKRATPTKKPTTAAKPRAARAPKKATAAVPAKRVSKVAAATAPAKRTSKKAAAAAVTAVDRTAEVSQDVLESIESAQRAAIDAIRNFVDTIDDALPALGERPSIREKVIDAALGMADSLVSTQYDFLRRLVRNVDDSLTAPRTAKD